MNQQQPTGQQPPKAVAPWLLIVLIIVVLAGAGYFGWYFYSKSKATKSSTTPATTTPATTTTTPSTTSDTSTATTATADWKTYTNDTYKFSIKYPATLTYELSNSDKTIVFQTAEDKAKYDACAQNKETECINTSQLVIDIDATVGTTNGDDVNLTLDQIIQNRITQLSISKDSAKTTLSGQLAYEGIGLGMFSDYEIISKNNSHVYDLRIVQNCTGSTVTLESCKKQETDTQKNMLSTFTFTK